MLLPVFALAWPILPPAPPAGRPTGTILGVEPTFSNGPVSGSRMSDPSGMATLLAQYEVVTTNLQRRIAAARPGDPFHGATITHGTRPDYDRSPVEEGYIPTPETTVHFPADPARGLEAFTIDVFPDPRCMEMNMSPGTVQQYRNRLPRLNAFWDLMGQSGVHPNSVFGGGHIHIDLETAFHGNALAYRNFLALIHSNQWMADGGLRYPGRSGSSSQARLLDERQLAQLTAVFREWDKHFRDPNTPTNIRDKMTVNTLMAQLASIYGGRTSRNQALSIDTSRHSTNEYRGVSAYQTPEDMVRMVEMFEGFAAIANEAASQGRTIELGTNRPVRGPEQPLDYNHPAALQIHAAEVRRQFGNFIARPDLQQYDSFRRLRDGVFRLNTTTPWLPFEHLTPPGQPDPYSAAVIATRPGASPPVTTADPPSRLLIERLRRPPNEVLAHTEAWLRRQPRPLSAEVVRELNLVLRYLRNPYAVVRTAGEEFDSLSREGIGRLRGFLTALHGGDRSQLSAELFADPARTNPHRSSAFQLSPRGYAEGIWRGSEGSRRAGLDFLVEHFAHRDANNEYPVRDFLHQLMTSAPAGTEEASALRRAYVANEATLIANRSRVYDSWDHAVFHRDVLPELHAQLSALAQVIGGDPALQLVAAEAGLDRVRDMIRARSVAAAPPRVGAFRRACSYLGL